MVTFLICCLTLLVIPAMVAHFAVLSAHTGRLIAFLGVLIALPVLAAGFGLDIRRDPAGILVAGRNHYSLARFQMALWTWLILAALIAAVACRAWGLATGADISNALSVGLNGDLLAVMGISYFTGAATPALLAVKSGYDGGRIAELSSEGSDAPRYMEGHLIVRPSQFHARFADLVESDDAGNVGAIDLSKVQQLLLTLVLVVVYGLMLGHLFVSDALFSVANPALAAGAKTGAQATQAAADLANTARTITLFPDFPPDLMKLLLISHASYLGYNAVPKPAAVDNSSALSGGPPPTPDARRGP